MTVNLLKQDCPSEDDSSSLRLRLRGVTQSAVKLTKIVDCKKQLPFIPKSSQDFYQQIIEGASNNVDDYESGAEDAGDTLQEMVNFAYVYLFWLSDTYTSSLYQVFFLLYH